MIIWRDPTEVQPTPGGRAVAIGAFDGVHLGHQAVLRVVHDLARARGLTSTVLTFNRHPAEVVRPGSAPKLLTTLEQKLELLDATGAVDECLVLPFDETRSKEPAEDFVSEVLAGVLDTRLVVVGDDFHFGYRRHGDVPLLKRMGAELGFEVLGYGLIVLPESEGAPDGGVPYSSTQARELLARGDVERAAAILGRPHEVRGTVERGDQRGRDLGFPTANIAVPERICLPDDGVFSGTYIGEDDIERKAAISLGRRPTFYEESGLLLLEAYVLDFEGDLYGQAARVRFHRRLRGQERFEHVDDLIAQMARDVEQVRGQE